MALITAVLFAFVATILMTAAAAYALHDLNTTSIDRKEVQSSGAAGAAIDLAISDLQSGTPPCSISGTLSSAPTSESYTANISYYDSTGGPLSCSGGVLPNTLTAASAVIKATGTNSASSTYGARTMQAEVTMAPVSAQDITDALFGNGGMSFAQTVTLYGQSPSNNANVYSNGDWSCSQAGNIYGNLYVQGAVSSHCSVAGAVTSAGNQTLYASYGSAATAGSPSNPASSITVGNGATVAGKATASGPIINHGGAINGVDANQTGLPGPTVETFPSWAYNQSSWSALGYTNFVDPGSDCTALNADITAMASPTAPPTVIQTSCQFSPSPSQPPYLLANNLAIFDSAGLNTSSAAFESSTAGASHDFYFIVPSTGLTVGSCTVPFHALSLTVGTSTNPLTALLYTPCDMDLSQATEMYGQVYAGGTLSVAQDFTLQYAPFSWPGSGSPNASYSVNIVYERANP